MIAVELEWKIRLDNAEKTVPSVWVEASVYAVGFVMLGGWLFQVPGAIAGASIGYFVGKKLKADAGIAAGIAVKQIRDRLAEASSEIQDARNMKNTFTRFEAWSGVPDTPSKLLLFPDE